MSGLPNIKVEIQNGRLGRVDVSDDRIAGLIVTGNSVTNPASANNLVLNRVYLLGSIRDLIALGVTKENNPLAYKDVAKFYAKAGEGAELYLLVVSQATTLQEMCSNDPESAVNRIMTYAKGRIRLLGLNRVPPTDYSASTEDTGIDNDAVLAGESLHSLGESYAAKISPFRAILPAIMWDGATDKLYKPRSSSFNRVGYVLASDSQIEGCHTASIGEALGVAASLSVHQSIARVKSGAVTLEGRLTDGKTPEENESKLDILHDAGYILYRTFPGRNGYYYNDDPTAASKTDDYSQLAYGRTIDKAIMLVYNAYLDELNDNIEIDRETGQIPVPMCRYYEGLFDNAVAAGMQDEISGFESFIDEKQNILRDEELVVAGEITPKGTLRKFRIQLGFNNPALNQQ